MGDSQTYSVCTYDIQPVEITQEILVLVYLLLLFTNGSMFCMYVHGSLKPFFHRNAIASNKFTFTVFGNVIRGLLRGIFGSQDEKK